MDYYEYDELGRMTRILRKNPADENKNAPRPDKTLLNVEYDYDAVGNIRHTKTQANYTGYTTVQSDDYFLYDENDRMSVNKGQLVDNQIKITASQGSSLQYDAAGNIQTALKYEQGALHQYTYQYNNDNQLELIKKNNYSIQSKIYDDAGRVITENLYNNKGQVTQKNIMTYDKGELVAQHVKNHADVEQSHTIYKYDEAGNITDTTVTAYEAGTKNASTYSHHYSYALWDNYLQENDYATQTHAGQSTSGKSTRYYDANGLLKQSIDNQHDENNYSHSSKYWNSAIDGMKARQDDSGITHYLNANHKTIGDLHLKNNKSQELNVFGGFTPQGSTHSKNIGSGSLGEFLARQAQSRGEGIEPESPQDNLGAYTVQSSDSLESIALQVYGDGSLWYLIADANGLNCSKSEIAQGSSSLHSGQRLTIPPVATGQHHTDGTKKIRSAEYYIGNTSATTLTPLPPAPPPFPKERNNIFAKIVVGVVATVATVLTAGVAGVLAGVAGSSIFTIGSAVLAGSAIGSIGGTMAAGFAAGVIGNLVSQGIGTALKLQDSINIKGALVNGLISAATAGVLKGVDQIATHKAAMTKLGENKLNTYFNLQSAAETMEYNATSQGMALAIHQQQHFQWDQFAVSAATAGILGGKAGKALQEKLKQIDFNTGLLSSEFNALAHNALGAVTGAAFNAKDALVGNLGGALGQGVVNVNTEVEEVSLGNGDEVLESFIEPVEFPEGNDTKSTNKIDISSLSLKSREKQPFEREIEIIANKKLLKDKRFKDNTELESEKKIYITKPNKSEQNVQLMKSENKFEELVKRVIHREGGKSNDKNDIGGETNMGISFKFYKKYREDEKIPDARLKKILWSLSKEDVKKIYKNEFWLKIRADEIKSFSITDTFFDFYVNVSPSSASRAMQKALNDLGQNVNIDGKYGSKTLAAINEVNPKSLFVAFNKRRIEHYYQEVHRRPSQKANLHGWLNRVNDLFLKIE